MKGRTDTHIADLVDDYVKVQSLALQKKKKKPLPSGLKIRLVIPISKSAKTS